MRTLTASLAVLGLMAAGPALAGNCSHGGYHKPAGAGHHPYAPPMAYGAPRAMPVGGSGYGYGYDHGHGDGHGYGMKRTGSYGATAADQGPGDIVDIAAGAGTFNTLVSAVKAADLVDTLKGDGPFTVFAPTDEAFARIPADQLKALLADKEALTDVLTYHVVPGKVMAADVVKLSTAATVQGQEVRIDAADGVKVDGANVVKTDIVAENGVIHVIDRVILPN